MISGINSNLPAGNVSGPLKPIYLENLSAVAYSFLPESESYGKYNKQEIGDAWQKLNAREYAAFLHLGTDASTAGIKKYAQAYIQYYDQLSPDEQNSPRYKGTRESVSNLLAQANTQLAVEGANPDKEAEEPTSLLLMLFERMKEEFEKQNGKGEHASGIAPRTEDKVTLSAEARKLSTED